MTIQTPTSLLSTGTEPRVISTPDRMCGSGAVDLILVNSGTNPSLTRTFFEEKHRCYSRFQAGAASLPLSRDIGGDVIHFIGATERQSGRLVGGVGIYSRVENACLPLELAIGEEASVRAEMDHWSGRHVVELSGLWLDATWRKSGLSEAVMLVAMAACKVIGAELVVGFSHQHVLAFYGSIGLLPAYDLGQFSYPNADYRSTVVRGDPVDFSSVPDCHRTRVLAAARCLAECGFVTWVPDSSDS